MQHPFFWKTRLLPSLLALVFLFGAGVAPGHAKSGKPKIKDLADMVAANRILTQFNLLVQGSGLASFMSSRGPFVLFVPTNSAFSRLPPGTVDALLLPANHETLQRIVLFHLVNGQLLTAKDLLKLKSLLSCEGHPLPLHVARSGAQLVAKARILHADIRCANGLLDLVDTVLVPPGVTLPPPAPPAPPAPVVTTTSTSDVSTNEATDDASPDMDASTNASAPAPASAPSTNDIPVAPIAH